jgi:hypothetical protein
VADDASTVQRRPKRRFAAALPRVASVLRRPHRLSSNCDRPEWSPTREERCSPESHSSSHSPSLRCPSASPQLSGEGRIAGSPEPAGGIAYFHANGLAVAAHSAGTDLSTYRDGPQRAVPPSGPVQTTSSDSGRQIEWRQLGIGFGLGILLVSGLWLAMRVTKFRPLAPTRSRRCPRWYVVKSGICHLVVVR